MARIKIESRLKKEIERSSKGSILFAEDFLEIGNMTSVNRALSRLAQKSVIVRLAQGIYLYPEKNEEFGILYPSIEDVARIIADRDRSRIMPSGELAMNRLGLSTQIPMNFVYLTDGSPRSIKIGKSGIKFKKTAPKNLSFKGNISSLIIQALKKIGKGNVSDSDKRKIRNILIKENPGLLKNDLKLAPDWIRRLLIEIQGQE